MDNIETRFEKWFRRVKALLKTNESDDTLFRRVGTEALMYYYNEGATPEEFIQVIDY